MAAPAIELRSVAKRYGDKYAVRDVTLEIEKGEFVSLLGPSGCGKTTLLRVIGGFLDPDAGEVYVHGSSVVGLPPNKRPVNTVFQSYALFPHMSVAKNVAFPLEIAKVGREERESRVAEMLEMMRLSEHAAKGVSALSGGQAQRVALARALVGRPEVLLLDEPLAALDLKLRKAMQFELRRIHERVGTTFLYVTHDQEEALSMSDRVVLMRDGQIEQQGTPRSVYQRPESAFASDFLGAANLIDATVVTYEAGYTKVAIAGIEVRAKAWKRFAQGEEVVVSIRPERVSLLRSPAEAPPGSDMVNGVVQQSVFQGHSTRHHVEIAPGLVITVESRQTDLERISPGEKWTLSWLPDDALVLPAGGMP